MVRIDHPKLSEIEVKHQLGRTEAEQFLRGIAASDQAAAKAVQEIDTRRAQVKADTLEANTAFAAELGLDLLGARQLVETLAADRDLFTWLCGRVHLAIAHDRPLDDDE